METGSGGELEAGFGLGGSAMCAEFALCAGD